MCVLITRPAENWSEGYLVDGCYLKEALLYGAAPAARPGWAQRRRAQQGHSHKRGWDASAARALGDVFYHQRCCRHSALKTEDVFDQRPWHIPQLSM